MQRVHAVIFELDQIVIARRPAPVRAEKEREVARCVEVRRVHLISPCLGQQCVDVVTLVRLAEVVVDIPEARRVTMSQQPGDNVETYVLRPAVDTTAPAAFRQLKGSGMRHLYGAEAACE